MDSAQPIAEQYCSSWWGEPGLGILLRLHTVQGGCKSPPEHLVTRRQSDGKTGSPSWGKRLWVGQLQPSVLGQPALTFAALHHSPSSLPANACPGRRKGGLSFSLGSSPW